MKLYSACLAVPVLLATMPASATLLGEGFSARYYVPNSSTIYPNASVPADFVVGAGVEGSIDVEGVTDIVFDFDALSLAISFNTVLSSPTWNAAAFNGIIFTSATPLDVSGAFVVNTTMSGFDNSRVTASGNQITLNWQGLGYVDGTQINIAFSDVRQTPVPELATWAMMVAGFGLAGGALRTRTRRIALAG